MEEHTRRRYLSAERMAGIFRDRFGACAAMVTGSVADDACDAVSDIDMTAYYDCALPSLDALDELRQELGGSARAFQLGSHEEGGYAEGYSIHGVKHDMGHATIDAINRDLDEIFVKLVADSPVHKIASGIQKCIVFYGHEVIGEWKDRIAEYPAPLAENMVKVHLAFQPTWLLTDMAAGRGDFLFYYEQLHQMQHHILGVLMGLNRVYHWGEYKRMNKLLPSLPIAPPNLYARLEAAWSKSSPDAVADMADLAEETMALVAREMPQIDLTAAAERLRRSKPTAD